MTAGSALRLSAEQRSGLAPVRGSSTAVTARTAHQSVKTGLIWGAVYALYVVGSASGFAASYPTEADRARLAASLGGNAGFTALLGTARGLDTVAGFTAWRTMGVLSIVGPVWALLLATKLTRGEEDNGRWEIYLSGLTTRRQAAVQAMLGVLAAPLIVLLVTAAGTVLDGRSSKVGFTVTESVFLALALVAPAVVFLAVGVFVAQLAARRRQATTISAAALAAAFVCRLLGDSGVGLEWLRRVTPLGWAELQRPLAGSNWRATAVLLVATVLLLAAAAWLAGRRDVGSGLLRSADSASPRTALLGSPAAFAVRQTRSLAIGWLLGVAMMGAVGGLVAESASKAIAGNTTVEQALQRLGANGLGATAYLGVIFLVIAALASFAGAAMMTSIRADESEGFLDHLLVRPVGRVGWLAGRLLVAAVALVVISLAAGVASWLGTASQHAGVPFGDLIKAGINVFPAAVLVLGVGACCFGLAPRLTGPVCYAVVAWSFLIELVASAVKLNHWVVDTSLFAHLKPAPAVTPNWTSAVWLCVLGLALAGLGLAAFRRRDLAGE